MEDVTKIKEFLDPGSGSGDGSGDGSGYGSGDGSGYGSGDGSGYGYGSGDGSGYSSGSGIKSLAGALVHLVDDVQTIIDRVRGNIAKGRILKSDLTTEPCFIVKQNGLFAHGPSLREAMEALRDKLFEDMSEEDRIEAFVQEHKLGVPYPNQDLYNWHHRLTGSCEMGRQSFVRDRGLTLDGETDVETFIELTRNAYGGSTIRKLAKRMELAEKESREAKEDAQQLQKKLEAAGKQSKLGGSAELVEFNAHFRIAQEQVADYTNVPEVARAAEMGVRALEKVERLEKHTERHVELVRKLRGTVSESKRQMLDDAADAIESLKAELEEERYRHDRYVDYAVERDGMFDRLIDDLKLVAKEGGTPCGLCRWAYAPLPCRDGPDYPCEKCIHGGCVCHSCRDYDKWLWRGMPEVKHEGN